MPENPPAFPGHRWDRDQREYMPNDGGMSLRDYFAGQAIGGIINQSTIAEVAQMIMTVAATNGVTEHDVMACAAYRYADAMLAEREKGGA